MLIKEKFLRHLVCSRREQLTVPSSGSSPWEEKQTEMLVREGEAGRC